MNRDILYIVPLRSQDFTSLIDPSDAVFVIANNFY